MTTEQPFETCIVRLFTMDKNKIVGTGFLVSEKYVLTCAHVVAETLPISKNSAEKPTKKIHIDFPFVAKNTILEAQVIIWHKTSTDDPISDIAVLEIANELPNACQPISILLLNNYALYGDSFQSYGFPNGHNDGLWAEGKIKRGTSAGWIQIEGNQQQAGYGIAPGFSGAPIWNMEKEGIVGMVVAFDDRESNSIAFFIPTDILVKAWPKLRQYCRCSQKRLPAKSKFIPPILSYLPDRDDQVWALRKAIQIHVNEYPNKHRPLLCLIHGDEYQCHGRLVERFVLESLVNIIPEQMANSDVRPQYLPLPTNIDGFHEKILTGLGDLFGIPFVSSHHEIAQTIADTQYISPVILYSEIYTEDWQSHGKTNIIHDFLEFWANWPILNTQKHLLLICLCFNYRYDKLFWLKHFLTIFHNYKIRHVFNDLALEQPHEVVVLPELLSIEKRHVEQWAKIYLNDHSDEIMPYIRDLFKKPGTKIAMEPLARQLKKILNECCNKRTFQI